MLFSTFFFQRSTQTLSLSRFPPSSNQLALLAFLFPLFKSPSHLSFLFLNSFNPYFNHLFFRATRRNPLHHRRALQPTLPSDQVPLFLLLEMTSSLSISNFTFSPDDNTVTTPSPLSNALGLIISPDLITSTASTLFPGEEEDLCTPLNISCVCHMEYASYEGLERWVGGLYLVRVTHMRFWKRLFVYTPVLLNTKTAELGISRRNQVRKHSIFLV